MNGINQILLMGNVTVDPELKIINETTRVCKFNLAVGESYNDKNGQKVESAEFFSIEAWNVQADLISKYVKKGNPLIVQGKIKTDVYDDKDGKKVYRTKVKMESMNFVPTAKPQDGQQNNVPNNNGVPANGYPNNNGAPVNNYPVNNGAPVNNYPNNNGAPVNNYPVNNGVPANGYPNNNGAPVNNYPVNNGVPANGYPNNNGAPVNNYPVNPNGNNNYPPVNAPANGFVNPTPVSQAQQHTNNYTNQVTSEQFSQMNNDELPF